MALAKCRECGKQVSSEASKCPQCGVAHPCPSPVLGIIYLLGFAFLGYLFFAGDCSDSRVQKPSSSQAAESSVSQLQALQSKGDRLAEEAKVLQKTAAWIALDGADEGEMREITKLLNKNTAELDRVAIQIEQLRNR